MTQPNPAPNGPDNPTPPPASGQPPASGDTPQKDDPPLGPEGERALERVKAELREAKAKVKEYEPLAQKAREQADAEKSEAQRAAEARAQAEARAAAAEVALMRYRVGAEKGVPHVLIDRLAGSTEDEMREDADRLMAVIGTAPGAPAPQPPPRGDAAAGGGAPGGGAPDMNTLLRALATGRAG